jgi:hypothetical protein
VQFIKLGNWKQQFKRWREKYGNAVQPLFKKVSHFLKKVISIKEKCCLFHSHFLKKVISLFKKAYLNHRKSFSTLSKKVFSEKKSDQKKREKMLFYTPLYRQQIWGIWVNGLYTCQSISLLWPCIKKKHLLEQEYSTNGGGVHVRILNTDGILLFWYHQRRRQHGARAKAR